MDDKPSIRTPTYDKSNDLKEPKLWKRLLTVAKAAPLFIIKLLIVTFALIFETLQQIFFCFVPRRLKNIRGQLAVVSVGCNAIFSILQ